MMIHASVFFCLSADLFENEYVQIGKKGKYLVLGFKLCFFFNVKFILFYTEKKIVFCYSN